MIPASSAKLIQDARLVRTTGALIAAVDAGQGLAFGGQTHTRGLGNHECESTFQQTTRPPPPPGNIYFESTRGSALKNFRIDTCFGVDTLDTMLSARRRRLP